MGFKFQCQADATKGVESIGSTMALDQPTKRLLVVQFVFDTRNRQPALSPGQIPITVACDHNVAVRDNERLSEGVFALFSKDSDLGRWSDQSKTIVAGVRAKFVHAISYESAWIVIRFSCH